MESEDSKININTIQPVLDSLTASRMTLAEQIGLLNRCLEKKLELADVLTDLGYSYNDLRYRHNGILISKEAPLTTPESNACPENDIPSVSFFSGCGGLDIGFEYAGFTHLASFDINQLFCDTLRKNRATWNIFGPPDYEGDLTNWENIEAILKNRVGIQTPFEGVFHGGPPCQPFSIAANQRFMKSDPGFKRVGYNHDVFGTLLFDYIHYIEYFKPLVFLIENVPGLMTIDNGEQLKRAMKTLSSSGYYLTSPKLINAADYGVPQNRIRLFFCGWRTKKQFMFPNHESQKIPCYKAFENISGEVNNQIIRKHKAVSILRYMGLNYGERDKLGRVDRLDPNLPSKTVIAGGAAGGGRSHLHPFIPRTLSPRESARLQTFPDDFVFLGPPARQFTQIGNAVPPLFALKIANAIHKYIYK